MIKPLLTISCVAAIALTPMSAQARLSKSDLTSKAMQGDLSAQFELCLHYLNEGGDSIDLARSWCEKSAMNGHLDGQMNLAWILVRHAENPDDLRRGYQWFSVALAQKYDFTAYREWQALRAHFGRDEKTIKQLDRDAMELFKEYVNIREYRELPDLIARNKSSHIGALKSKADGGDAQSIALMGMYHESRGENANALEWYQRAARAGYLDTQFYLGRMLPEHPVGALYDDTQRYAWLSLALAQEYNYIDRLSLNLLAERMDKAHLQSAQTLAQTYFDEIIGAENERVEDNIDHAESTYMEMLLKQDKNAKNRAPTLTRQYKSGIAVFQDQEPSKLWHKRAAENGSVLAQYTLGHMYEEGIAYPQDTPKAAAWYKKAAIHGYTPAQYALGKLYFSNLTSAQSNIVEAYAWLDIVARQGYDDAAVMRDAVAKKFNKEDDRLAGILARKYHRLYVEAFAEEE